MGTRERRQREAAERREVILAAAKKRFWTHGYAGTTMPQIADDAELAPGTLYLYFPSKSALYAELLCEGYEVLRRRLEEALESMPADPAAQAEGLIETFYDFARESPAYFDIIFFILRREGGREKNLEAEQLERILVRQSACKELVRQVLAHTPHGRAGDTHVDIEAIWSMLVGVVLCFKHDERLAEITAAAKRLLMTAVLTGDP